MFLAEFLYRALREEAENGPLFAYLEHSIRWLDECDRSFSNFHLVFLMRFSRFLGLYPNTEDYREGCFLICWMPVSCLSSHYMVLFETGGGFTYQPFNAYELWNNASFTMSRLERNRCLVIMNDYYRCICRISGAEIAGCAERVVLVKSFLIRMCSCFAPFYLSFHFSDEVVSLEWWNLITRVLKLHH